MTTMFHAKRREDVKIARVFPRRTNASPRDPLAFFGPPGLFPPKVDAVHVSVTFSWDKEEAERLAEEWRRVAPVAIGGPAMGKSAGQVAAEEALQAGTSATMNRDRLQGDIVAMEQAIAQERMPPTRIARYCCEALKEGGGVGRTVCTGIRWAESARRGKRRMVELCKLHPDKQYLHPVIDWTDVDVWDYIRAQELKVCSLYLEGWRRIGCVMCPMAGPKDMAKHADRWPKIAYAYKRAFQRCIDKRVADGLVTSWQTGKDMYDWWIGGCEKGAEDEHPWLFE